MNYYDFAKKNLKSAETMNKYTDEYDVIVVDCQQYLEKSLKYLLELKCGELTRVHKLTVITSKLNIEELNKHEDIFRRIQDYYFDKRYPGDNYLETSKDECAEVFKFTISLKPFIEELILKYTKEEIPKDHSGIFDKLIK